MRSIRGINHDINFYLLVIILGLVAIFLSSSFMYTNQVSNLQEQYDRKVAVLEKVQRELILQEEKVYELQQLQKEIEQGKKSLHADFVSLQGEYDILRIEAKKPEIPRFKPFSNVKCNAAGSASC